MNTDTILAGLGGITDPAGGLVPALHLAVTHAPAPGGAATGYARTGPAGPSLLETLLARLDAGATAVGYASGASAALGALELLPPGQRLLLEASGYYEFRGILGRAAAARGIALALVDMTDAAAVATALATGGPALIWAEFPGNPMWQLPDLRALAALSRASGSRLLVDATAATPHHLRPITLGADIVLQSATKFLNGHGDLTAGALILSEALAPERARLLQARTDAGTILPPFAEWLLLRGLRTFPLRMARAASSAAALAGWLRTRPEVGQVLYPGLPDHPQHHVALTHYTQGFGPVLSFRLADRAAAERVVAAVRVMRRATSLGSTETLIERRAATEGAGTLCPEDLLRVSLGLEDPEDLIADLAQALDRSADAAEPPQTAGA